MSEASVLFEQRAGIGLIVLNRPQALNALTHDMIIQMQAMLNRWAANPKIFAVVVKASPGRAFCAGGDIRKIYEAGQKRDANMTQFFWDEYRLNRSIARFNKPYLSLMDGITMGGGVGISQHGGLRLGTPRYLFAIPETGIGFFPDVGGSFFLPRLPNHAGFYLALTGQRIDASQALSLGLIDGVIPSDATDAICDHLSLRITAETSNAELLTSLKSFLNQPPKTSDELNWVEINKIFSADKLESILARLQSLNTEWGEKTAQLLQTKSPMSLKVTLSALHHGQQLDLDHCLQMEYRLVQRFLAGHDFYEGVRAIVIDKNHTPVWQPATVSDVQDEEVASYFKPIEKELDFL